MRNLLTILLVIVGFGVQAVSYFLLAAPIGVPTSPAFSNPRLQFSPTLFVVGVMLVFIAAIVYELYPEEESE